MLRQRPEEPQVARYSSENAQKIIAMAGRLQDAASDHVVTVDEIEQIAKEVGVRPEFVRQALETMRLQDVHIEEAQSRRRQTVAKAPQKQATHEPFRLDKLWWATMWISIPVAGIFAGMAPGGRHFEIFPALAPFAYIGVGIFLSMIFKPRRTAAQVEAASSREALLEKLFELQQHLESTRVRRAFLSVDVAGSSELKATNTELAVEFSFGQYRRWVEEIVQAEGGLVQVAAGDGAMCIFPDDASAVRAGQRLLRDLPRFNVEQNRLSAPLRIRCGVSVGEVALEPGTPIGHLQSPVIDRAAALQKAGEPNSLVVSASVAPAALIDAGGFRSTEALAGEPAYIWRAG